jgi:integrase/recombinase XerD
MNTLRQAVQEYLDLRRSLGFKLIEAGKALPDFVAFMERHRASFITQALALMWAQQPSNVQPAQWARRLSIVCEFARHHSATAPRTQIPAPGLLPFSPKRARPYLYSSDETRRLLHAALQIPCRYARDELQPWT